VLRHSLDDAALDSAAFAGAVTSSAADPGRFAERLFAIRAEGLVRGLAPATARAQLSGILVGTELAAARADWQDQTLVIVGNGAQAETYADALRALGQSPRMTDASHVTLRGLTAARRHLA
jgi:2-dehydro-3-deoxygalactonokinase